MEEEQLKQFHLQVDLWKHQILQRKQPPKRRLFDLDPATTFSKRGGKVKRQKRQACPGGVGNFGFNSFNFMTFVLLTLNAVANVNNNINNNNNNNVNINYNTINQDSNNVISNSENMNMVMAMILPVPGKRSLEMLNTTLSHHISKRCAGNPLTLEELVMVEVAEQVEQVVGEEECEGLRVCLAVKHLTKMFLKDAINAELLELGRPPFLSMTSCSRLFPSCVAM